MPACAGSTSRSEDDAAPGPEFEQAWTSNRDAVMALLWRHGDIAIHCRSGSGRTGFMAALIPRELGMEGARGEAQVLRLRPKSLALSVHTDDLAADDGRRSPRNTDV